MPTINRRILLDDCDAAGVVFGPRLAAIAHGAYEEAALAAGLDLAAVVRGRILALPYVRLEVDFRAPLRHGDTLAATVSVGAISERSYTVLIECRTGEGAPVATVRQVHVALDPVTGRATALPEWLRTALGTLESPAS